VLPFSLDHSLATRKAPSGRPTGRFQPQDIAPSLAGLTQTCQDYLHSFYLDESPSQAAAVTELSQLRLFGYGRPPDAASDLPPTLLHPVFNEFLHDCEHHEPTEADHMFALELSSAMAKLYPDEEASRKEAFHSVCRDNHIYMNTSMIDGTDIYADSTIRVRGFNIWLGVVQNEMGETGAEPVFQAGQWYSHGLRGYEHFPIPFPCFGMYLVGESRSINIEDRLY
jgi:hypothetical protein